MGAPVRHLFSAFIAGEIDPLLAGRSETDVYALGLELCENFVPVNEGPLVKRPGFEYIRDAAPTASRLGAFRFSITQEYALEWSDLMLRFFTNGGRIETAPNVAYEVTTPYTAAEAPRLSTEQSYDRLYIDHAAHAPASLTRTGAATFAFATTTLSNGPFLDQNTDTTRTVTASGTSGTVTLTASSAMFAASDVGSQIELEAADFSSIKAWEPGMGEAGGGLVVIGDVVRSDGKAYTALTGGTTGSVVPTHSSGAEWDGQGRKDIVNAKGPYGVKWQYRHDRYGVARIDSFATTASVGVTVLRTLPDQVQTLGTWRWSLAAFSATRGWPGLVVNAFGRQIHIKDFDVNASVVNDYGGGQCNFARRDSTGKAQVDLAFRRTIATDNPPLWVAADVRKLLVGTATRELAIGAINSSLSLSGDNVEAAPQSFYGSEAVFPIQMGTQTLFIERGGRRLRAADYDFGRDRYVPQDLTAAARHVTRGGIVQLAVQRVPFGLVYAVRGDGQLVVHPDTRIEIKGFARTVLGGAAKALSAVSIVGADGKTDELWVLIERTRADGLKREIWKQAPWRDVGDAAEEQFFVDCGTRVAAAGGQTHFTGFTHLAGQPLALLAAGGVVPGIVCAADGSFDLPSTAVPATPYVLIVGLQFVAIATTNRPPATVNGAPIQGLRQKVVKAALRLLETVGIKLASTGSLRFEEPIRRPADAPMDAPIPLFTGDTPAGELEGDYDRAGRLTFKSEDPLNAVINSAIVRLDVDASDA